MIKYVFDEDTILKELQEYVDATYSEHYASQGRIQVTEFIASHCDSPDFFRGNAMKYLARYGHKEGYNRKDLLKSIHYLIMLLSWHDKTKPPENVTYTMEDIGELPYKIEGNTVPVSNVLVQNVYVKMGGGKIGQWQNGGLVEIGYGDLDEHGCLIKGTFSYSSEGKN